MDVRDGNADLYPEAISKADAMTTREKFYMWTVYDHPKDFPTMFVARKFRITMSGAYPTPEIMTHKKLDAIRAWMQAQHLSCLPRQPNDDAKIVEVWL